jgi:hypothetical protein
MPRTDKFPLSFPLSPLVFLIVVRLTYRVPLCTVRLLLLHSRQEKGAWHVDVARIDTDEPAIIPTLPPAVDPHDVVVACAQNIVRVDDDGDVDEDGHGMDDRVHAVSRVVVVVDGEEEDQGLDGQKQLWAHLLDSQLWARGFEQMRDSQWWVCGLVQL